MTARREAVTAARRLIAQYEIKFSEPQYPILEALQKSIPDEACVVWGVTQFATATPGQPSKPCSPTSRRCGRVTAHRPSKRSQPPAVSSPTTTSSSPNRSTRSSRPCRRASRTRPASSGGRPSSGYYARTHYRVNHPKTYVDSGYAFNLGYSFPTALGDTPADGKLAEGSGFECAPGKLAQ